MNNNEPTSPNFDQLSEEETKAIITPNAFVVDSSLFGLPLATPMRRGIAMLIDIAFVSILAQQDIALLLIVAAGAFFKVGIQRKQPKKWRKTRKMFRWLAIVIIAAVVYEQLDPIVEKWTSAEQVVSQKDQPSKELTDKPANDATNVTEWIKGIVTNDLGFGFGWAAFYFTLFSAWWQGQTPGKRALGIRVIQLDGTYMSLWDSFGRYGGYGAGFATGLLGFAQIQWDPNRQAIQDKISATVVIKGDLPESA